MRLEDAENKNTAVDKATVSQTMLKNDLRQSTSNSRTQSEVEKSLRVLQKEYEAKSAECETALIENELLEIASNIVPIAVPYW